MGPILGPKIALKTLLEFSPVDLVFVRSISWSQDGPKTVPRGLLGGVLGRPGAILGGSWAGLGAFGGLFGRSWGSFWIVWGWFEGSFWDLIR